MSGRRCMRAEKHTFLSLVEKRTGGVRERAQAFGLLSENMVIGDLASAETVVMAAYDTPRLRAMGCAYYPASRGLMAVQWLVRTAFSAGLAVICCAALRLPVWAAETAALAVLFLTCMAFPNRWNMNCNSSGVAALLDLWNRHQDEKTAFVLLDNDDLLHLGRRAFLKAHRRKLAHKTVIELYCVGRGDVFVVSCGNDSPPIDSSEHSVVTVRRGRQPFIRLSSAYRRGRLLSAGPIKTPADSVIDETTVLNAEQLIERNFLT